MNGAVIRVLVAGAAGVLGRELAPYLVAGGHEVGGPDHERIHEWTWCAAWERAESCRRARPRCGRPSSGSAEPKRDRASAHAVIGKAVGEGCCSIVKPVTSRS